MVKGGAEMVKIMVQEIDKERWSVYCTVTDCNFIRTGYPQTALAVSAGYYHARAMHPRQTIQIEIPA